MASEELKAAAQRELLRRQATAELQRRAAAKAAQQQPAEAQPSGVQQMLDAGKTALRIANPIQGVAQMVGDQVGQSIMADQTGDVSTPALPNRLAADRVPQELLDRQIAAGRQEAYDQKPWYSKAAIAADDVVRNIANGQTFGFADKAAAAANSAISDRSYADQLKIERERTQAAKDRAGTAATAAELTGNVMTGNALMKNGVTLAGHITKPGALPAVARAAASTVEGAGYGLLDASGNDRNLTEGATTGAIAGLGGSVAADLVSGTIAKGSKMLSADPEIPSLAKLKAAQSKAYKDATAAGVIIKPNVIDEIESGVVDELTKMSYRPKLMPQIKDVLDEISSEKGKNITLDGLDSLRRVAQIGGQSNKPAEREAARKIINVIDDKIASLTSKDLVTGDLAGAASLKNARALTVKVKKTEQVQEAVTKARRQAAKAGTGGNIENAMRQRIDGILSSKNARGWTADEKAVMDEIVSGSVGQNTLRLVGRLSPQGNGLMLWGSIAGSMANPALAVPAVVGGASKAIADRGVKKAVQELDLLVRSGGSKDALKSLQSTVARLSAPQRKALAQILMFSALSGETGNQQPSQQ